MPRNRLYFRRRLERNPKITQETKTGAQEEIEILAPVATVNSKHQINTKTHTKVPFYLYITSSFEQHFQSTLKDKTTKHKTQLEKTEPAKEPDSDVAKILKSSDLEFKNNRNMLITLMGKMDNMKYQMGNVSKKMKTEIKNQK